jgi:hypothetical protein
MRALVVGAIAALALASVAGAASKPASGPYHLDANHRCHASNGSFVPDNMCVARPVCDPAKSKPCGASCIALNKTCHKS